MSANVASLNLTEGLGLWYFMYAITMKGVGGGVRFCFCCCKSRERRMVWCLFKAKSIYNEEEEENLSLLFADWNVGKFVRGHGGLVTGHKKTLLFLLFL